MKILVGIAVYVAAAAVGEFVFGFKIPPLWSWQFVGFLVVAMGWYAALRIYGDD